MVIRWLLSMKGTYHHRVFVNWGYVLFICSGQGFRSEASVGIEVVEPAAVGGRQERLHAETARCFAVHFGIIEEEDV